MIRRETAMEKLREFLRDWLGEVLLVLALVGLFLVVQGIRDQAKQLNAIHLELRGVNSNLDELQGAVGSNMVRGYVIVRQDGALGVAWSPPRAVSVAPAVPRAAQATQAGQPE